MAADSKIPHNTHPRLWECLFLTPYRGGKNRESFPNLTWPWKKIQNLSGISLGKKTNRKKKRKHKAPPPPTVFCWFVWCIYKKVKVDNLFFSRFGKKYFKKFKLPRSPRCRRLKRKESFVEGRVVSLGPQFNFLGESRQKNRAREANFGPLLAYLIWPQRWLEGTKIKEKICPSQYNFTRYPPLRSSLL